VKVSEEITFEFELGAATFTCSVYRGMQRWNRFALGNATPCIDIGPSRCLRSDPTCRGASEWPLAD
jgi:hypothetical protein